MQTTFYGEVSATVVRHNMLTPTDTVIAGVSGGPDSVALLFALLNIRAHIPFSLAVAHFDHMLRGDSGEDAAFVEDLARKCEVPFFCRKENIAVLYRQTKGSLEDVARKRRLAFFTDCARIHNATKIALGHTLDDQAETVIMRLVRGAGIQGLCGMAPVRECSPHGIYIIRPLLKTRKDTVERFLAAGHIAYRTDITNFGTEFTRNKVRHRVLPLLETEFNPNIKDLLANMADTVRADLDFIAKHARRKMKTVELPDACPGRDSFALDCDRMRKITPALRRYIVRMGIERLKGDLKRITSRHLEEVETLIAERPGLSVVDLPGGIAVSKQEKRLVFHKKAQRASIPGAR